jgi:hypothetical protein
MKITDPKPFLDEIDLHRLQGLLGNSLTVAPQKCPVYVEPGQMSNSVAIPGATRSTVLDGIKEINGEHQSAKLIPSHSTDPLKPESENGISNPEKPSSDIFKGKIQRLGDFIDTDAVSPKPRLSFTPTWTALLIEFHSACSS